MISILEAEQIVDQQEAVILETMPDDIEQFQNDMRVVSEALVKIGLNRAAGVLLYGSAVLALKKARQHELRTT